MDSIALLERTFGHYGDKCKVTVSNGDTYTGIYRGYGESTRENPLMLRLGLSKSEATRIGVPYLAEIGIPYDVITAVDF